MLLSLLALHAARSNCILPHVLPSPCVATAAVLLRSRAAALYCAALLTSELPAAGAWERMRKHGMGSVIKVSGQGAALEQQADCWKQRVAAMP